MKIEGIVRDFVAPRTVKMDRHKSALDAVIRSFLTTATTIHKVVPDGPLLKQAIERLQEARLLCMHAICVEDDRVMEEKGK